MAMPRSSSSSPCKCSCKFLFVFLLLFLMDGVKAFHVPGRVVDIPTARRSTALDASFRDAANNKMNIMGERKGIYDTVSSLLSFRSFKKKPSTATTTSSQRSAASPYYYYYETQTADTNPTKEPSRTLIQEQRTFIPKRLQPVSTTNKEEKGKVQAATFNLIKAIVGSGLLALPSGLAAMSDHKISLIPAVSLLSIIGLFSAYTFGLYGRLTHSSQAKSLGEIWEHEKGKSSSWIISLATSTFCYGAALSYSIIIGDVFQNLAHSFGWTGIATSRSLWILLTTSGLLWPLCNLKSLSSLAPISMLGVFSVLFTVGFLGWRCPTLNAASPYGLVGGEIFLSNMLPHQLPQFNTFSNGVLSFSSLILTGMAATAFLGHFSAADIYHTVARSKSSLEPNDDTTTSSSSSFRQNGTLVDLQSLSSSNNDKMIATSSSSLRDYLKVTLGGFASVTVINSLALIFGFSTFGGKSNGVILNNFATMDKWATVCRLLMAFCVIGGYPFCIAAVRSEAKEIWNAINRGRNSNNYKALRNSNDLTTENVHPTETKAFKVGLLASLAGMALILKDAGFVVGLNGAVMGSALAYIFPSVMFLAHTSREAKSATLRLKMERWFCRFLIGFGVVAAVAGGGISIINTYFPHLLLKV